MKWKDHPPTCTCGKCEKDRASRARQQEVAQAKMTGQPIPAAPEKRQLTLNDIYNSQVLRAGSFDEVRGAMYCDANR